MNQREKKSQNEIESSLLRLACLADVGYYGWGGRERVVGGQNNLEHFRVFVIF
jgi:hypothetical protein